MGWLIVFAAKPAISSMTTFQLGWLLAGGLCYSGGVPFYLWKSRPFAHALWHGFVLAGVACHFVAILSVMDRAA
jgi:hemolysin III